ncbi:hypothetical protein GCM10010522_04450 [Kribbella solani]
MPEDRPAPIPLPRVLTRPDVTVNPMIDRAHLRPATPHARVRETCACVLGACAAAAKRSHG